MNELFGQGGIVVEILFTEKLLGQYWPILDNHLFLDLSHLSVNLDLQVIITGQSFKYKFEFNVIR